MNTDTIFKRYWSALCAITDEAHGLDDGSVRLALRMAIDDTAAMTQPDDAALVTARNEAAMLRQQLATERAEAVVSAIPWQSLLNIYESATVSDRDEDALGAFLGACIPASVFNSESEG